MAQDRLLFQSITMINFLSLNSPQVSHCRNAPPSLYNLQRTRVTPFKNKKINRELMKNSVIFFKRPHGKCIPMKSFLEHLFPTSSIKDAI